MKKKIPTFNTDEDAERFVESADLSEYDLSGAKSVRFEFEKKRRTGKYAPAEKSCGRVERTREAARHSLSAIYQGGSRICRYAQVKFAGKCGISTFRFLWRLDNERDSLP
jgi:hypothetical protein